MDARKTVGEDCQSPYEKPKVFLFDFEDAVVEKLKELRISCDEGSLGAAIRVNNEKGGRKLLRVSRYYPENLHEFDIVMLDLTCDLSEDYDPSQSQLSDISGDTAYAYLSAYPEQVFDSRPLNIHGVSKHINDLFAKKSIIVAFCRSKKEIEYKLVEINARGAEIFDRSKFSNFDFYSNFPANDSRVGRKVKLPEKETKLSALLGKHLDGISFETIFYHPKKWEEREWRLAENFIPLLLNERDEIISFVHCIGNALVFIFPNIEDKPNFVGELFKTYLPEIASDIFPFHGEFRWLDDGDYPLPGEQKLLQERTEIEEKFRDDLAKNVEVLSELKKKYKFLSDLITETGADLVSAVEEYLKWLDFELVINLDDSNPEVLEEDIQVDCGDRFLAIEIKGIGGTSTDKDCAQISKIRYRRAEQRGKFDVYGLYIVNHQRYMPPKSRNNPPFTEHQIKDAGHDKRGLLTTYDLYKAYFLIEEGILKKEDVRESLFGTGLIKLDPGNLVSVGVPHEFFKDGHVVIVNLDKVELNVGDALIVRKQGDYSKATIQSLQVGDKSVDACSEGEVGIKLDRKIMRGAELFVRKV